MTQPDDPVRPLTAECYECERQTKHFCDYCATCLLCCDCDCDDDDRDLDAEVPGSGELINWLGMIVEHHQQHKIRSGGTIGISYCRSHRSFGVHIGNGNRRYGYYTAKEAAAAYDAAALARYGEDAVLNDPDAVDTLELDVRDKILSTIL